MDAINGSFYSLWVNFLGKNWRPTQGEVTKPLFCLFLASKGIQYETGLPII